MSPPSISRLTLTLSFFLLFLAVATKPFANAQVPSPPADDRATITGRVYCDACQNGRFDPGPNYPRRNAQVRLVCSGTNSNREPPQQVTLTDVTTLTNGVFDGKCVVRVIRVAARCIAPVLLESATCNNPITFDASEFSDASNLHAGGTYNADVCFTEVPTPKTCITTTATGCARSLVSGILVSIYHPRRTLVANYTLKSVSLSNAPTKVLYTHRTKVLPKGQYSVVSSKVQVINDGGRRFVLWWNSTKIASTNANWQASPSLLYTRPSPNQSTIDAQLIVALGLDDSVSPNVVYWVEYIIYSTDNPDAYILKRGWLNASKTQLTNIKTFPLFTNEKTYYVSALQGLQVDSVHGRLYVGYLTQQTLPTRQVVEYIITVRNTRTDNLEAIVTKPLGVSVSNFPRIDKYADPPVFYSRKTYPSPVGDDSHTLNALFKMQLDLSNNTNPVLAKGYPVYTGLIPADVSEFDILYGVECRA
eukprot:jgi/Chlat1/589/Chrsp103S00947